MRILALVLLTIPLFSGCFAEGDTIEIAFVAKDNATRPHEDLDRLAAFMEDETGRPVEVSFFTSSTAALQAVAAGQADVASVDGAAGWLAWQNLGLEAVASEIRSDGRTFYNAAAWVRADSDIQSVDDFEGRTSCHTGATKSAGMFMPMGYLAREGHIDASQYPDDVSQVQEMAKDFFDQPVIGGAYGGYNGALQCLSEGVGDIAFIRDSTPEDYCADEPEPWCLGLDQYRMVLTFGQVPEHPFMVSPDLDSGTRQAIVDGLLALNDSEEGRDILDATFETGGIEAVSTEEHLGSYGSLIGQLPGIQGYAESK